jgi:diguanylate cyclase (GGDEF)-like protein
MARPAGGAESQTARVVANAGTGPMAASGPIGRAQRAAAPPAEAVADRKVSSGERGPAYFGKTPSSIQERSGKVDMSYHGGAGTVSQATSAIGTGSGRMPSAQESRTEKIDARSNSGFGTGGLDTPKPGKFIPQGPASEHDFDKWKDRKLVDELQAENIELTNLLTMLPGYTKRLSETTKKRELAPLLADMVLRLCVPTPEKVMIFFVSSKRKEELVLAARVGYGEAGDDGGVSQMGVKIPRAFGRVGYAVKNLLTMDQKDFERDHIDDQPPPGQLWKTEIAAPMVYDKEVIGVISAEGFPQYSRNAKRLIGVFANLGALAISLAEKKAQLEHQANSDALTQLFNKRYFFERLEWEVERARDTGRPLSLFMFDIDHFKKYNDRNGHQAGDEALKITGQLLNERRRENDIAARYGGEEFIVILPNTNKEGAYTFGESFRKLVEGHPYPHGEGQPLGKVSISGGVATMPEDGVGPTSLIEAADACLYRSKEAGRNLITKQRAPRDVLA